jgi:hypothetical protein
LSKLSQQFFFFFTKFGNFPIHLVSYIIIQQTMGKDILQRSTSSSPQAFSCYFAYIIKFRVKLLQTEIHSCITNHTTSLSRHCFLFYEHFINYIKCFQSKLQKLIMSILSCVGVPYKAGFGLDLLHLILSHSSGLQAITEISLFYTLSSPQLLTH